LDLSDCAKQAMRQRARQCFVQHFEIKKAAATFYEVLTRITGMN
jgi:hypothetical protein